MKWSKKISEDDSECYELNENYREKVKMAFLMSRMRSLDKGEKNNSGIYTIQKTININLNKCYQNISFSSVLQKSGSHHVVGWNANYPTFIYQLL